MYVPSVLCLWLNTNYCVSSTEMAKATMRPVKYTEIHSRKHAASASSRNHKYIGTILIPDSDAEDEGRVEENERPSKKRKSQ